MKITWCLSAARSRRRGATRETGVARQENSRDVAPVGVYQCRLCFEERRKESTAGLELERAVVADPGHPEADFVQMGNEHDDGAALADPHPQVARGVGLALGPAREQPLHGLSRRALGPRDAVGLHEWGEDGLRLGDSNGVLGGKTVER